MISLPAPDARFGWLGPAAAQEAFDTMGEAFSPFAIAGKTRETAGGRLVLWEFARRANHGRHLPTLRQQRGSCVGHGAAAAVWYLAAFERVRLQNRECVVMPYEPFLYGTSRVQVGGGRLRTDGSLGIWAAQAVRKYGVLRSDLAGLPRWTEQRDRGGRVVCVTFDPNIDLTWGKPPGPPEECLTAARPHPVKATAPVRTYADVRDALLNGYPVTVASLQGFRMTPRVDRGKHWGVPAGQWAHQMCFIGCDDDAARPGCYCLNSWGPDAHGPPADDAPPGGFWVDADIVERMVAQGDSFAFSQFEGFPEQTLDFQVIGRQHLPERNEP